jgi:regulator of sirC expression with transglutaminase-like and TPR domain
MEAFQFISQFVELPDEKLPLLKAALGIALVEYPELDIEEELRKFDSIVAAAKERVEKASDQNEGIILLSDFFKEVGFRGNSADYYNPRNSFLNEVLERKNGIPIARSLVYLEAADRLGIKAHGVGFPGHFIVGHEIESGNIYLDPFNSWRRIGLKEMDEILDVIYQGKARFDPSFLTPISKRMILVRMLNNLKSIYWEDGDLRKALQVLRCICSLAPDSAFDLRDKGLVNYQMQNYEEAMKDLTKYVESKPDAQDSNAMLEIIPQIRLILGRGR